MIESILSRLSRADRRMLLQKEAADRRAGSWGPWETLTFPQGTVGSGWAADFTTAHRNRVFCVLDRTLENGVRHFAVRSLSSIRPTWPEMQHIKDTLAGHEATAVEVYPPAAEVVDEADMYHIWVLPAPLLFSLAPRPPRVGR
jgi:hypothetical protein